MTWLASSSFRLSILRPVYYFGSLGEFRCWWPAQGHSSHKPQFKLVTNPFQKEKMIRKMASWTPHGSQLQLNEWWGKRTVQRLQTWERTKLDWEFVFYPTVERKGDASAGWYKMTSARWCQKTVTTLSQFICYLLNPWCPNWSLCKCTECVTVHC